MSEINFTPEVYNDAISHKKYNEDLIAELYASYATMTFDDKLIAMELISNLKILNDEYDKYILVYQSKIKNDKRKTFYTVIEGDTLQRIAVKYSGDANNWTKIYEYNHLTDTILSPGDSIEIPEKF